VIESNRPSLPELLCDFRPFEVMEEPGSTKATMDWYWSLAATVPATWGKQADIVAARDSDTCTQARAALFAGAFPCIADWAIH
jgi:hypothetical protein